MVVTINSLSLSYKLLLIKRCPFPPISLFYFASYCALPIASVTGCKTKFQTVLRSLARSVEGSRHPQYAALWPLEHDTPLHGFGVFIFGTTHVIFST